MSKKTYYIRPTNSSALVKLLRDLSDFEPIEANSPEEAVRSYFNNISDEVEWTRVHYYWVYDSKDETIDLFNAEVIHRIDINRKKRYGIKLEADSRS